MAIREKLKLGDVLLKAGVIKEEHLKNALEFQKAQGIQLGSALIQLKFITEEQLINSLSKQLNIPYMDLAET